MSLHHNPSLALSLAAQKNDALERRLAARQLLAQLRATGAGDVPHALPTENGVMAVLRGALVRPALSGH